jgi:DNA-binding MarR family transcriptional regulator
MPYAKVMEELIDELRLGLHRVAEVSEELHAEEPVSVSMRAVLEFLLRNSDSSVPTIARSRHVSRQLIQLLVNALLEQELVELRDNPAHRRSPLIALTPAGEKLIRRMRSREARFFEAMSRNLSEARIAAATRTLRAIRAELSEESS